MKTTVSVNLLHPVYAVKRSVDKDGNALFHPRSQASMTATQPKLWSSRKDADKKARAVGGEVVMFCLLMSGDAR